MTLERPTSFFLTLVALQPFFPVRRDIIEKNGDAWTQNPTTYIGNGAFILKAWNHNLSIEMERNGNYYDKDKVRIASITWKLVDNETAALNAFETGELDFLSGFMNTNELPRLFSENKVTRMDALGVSYVIFNMRREPFKSNGKLRQALSLAIDRRSLTDSVLREGGKPATGFIAYGLPGIDASDFREDSQAQDFLSESANLDEAKRLLMEAGYPDGKGLPVFDYLAANDTTNIKIAEFVQDQWSKIGVKIKINAMEQKVRSQLRSEGKYDITKGSWGGDFMDPNTFLSGFVSDSPNNYGRWSNGNYDQFVAQSTGAKDQSVGISFAHQAENVMMNELPIIPLFFTSVNALVAPGLKGTLISPLYQISFTASYWSN